MPQEIFGHKPSKRRQFDSEISLENLSALADARPSELFNSEIEREVYHQQDLIDIFASDQDFDTRRHLNPVAQ